MSLQDSFTKEDGKSFQGTSNDVKNLGKNAPKPAKPEGSDTINSVLVKATFGISENSWNNALNRSRSQPSRPVVLVDRIVLVSICIVVILGFCVPIIIYAVDTERGGAGNSTIVLDLDVDQCSSVSVMLNQVCNQIVRSLAIYFS